jgi:hypothetical protein
MYYLQLKIIIIKCGVQSSVNVLVGPHHPMEYLQILVLNIISYK